MDIEDEYTSDEEIRYSTDGRYVSVKHNQQYITQVSNTLSIPRVSATILLCHYNWDVGIALDEWFADEERVRKDLGLLEKQVEVLSIRDNTEKDNIKCPVCLDEFPASVMSGAACGKHVFCYLCWTQCVSIKIGCPDPSCAVDDELVLGVNKEEIEVNELVLDVNKEEKNSASLDRVNIEEDNKKTKRCPAPFCEYAVEFVASSSSYDVVCCCGHSFCWNCLGDTHRPVDCHIVNKWSVKNSAESENVTWILDNCKACPNCRQPIEKDDGCTHVTCSCQFEFCWLCLGDWSSHGNHIGGNSACYVYEKAIAEGQQERIIKKAKNYLDRYIFFYGRFSEYHESMLKAVERLQKVKVYDLAKLSDRYGLTDKQLEFLTDAWLQIIECRHVLKWTSAYGYYLPTSEHTKQKLFGYLQGVAESGLESLRRCAEVELQTYLKEKSNVPKEDFNTFRGKLVGLTSVTRKYFENLVRSLENGQKCKAS